MPTLDWLLPVATFAFSSLATPGPNNIIIATSCANFGFRRGLPVILGVSFGFSGMVLCVTLGAASIFAYFPATQQVLRLVGFGFMLYLAWKIATASMADQDTAAPPSFWHMVLFQWINPKAWTMSAVAAVAFTASGSLGESLAIALVFLFVSLPCQLLWGGFGSAIGGFLRASRFRLRAFNVAMAILMVAAFVPVLMG